MGSTKNRRMSLEDISKTTFYLKGILLGFVVIRTLKREKGSLLVGWMAQIGVFKMGTGNLGPLGREIKKRGATRFFPILFFPPQKFEFKSSLPRRGPYSREKSCKWCLALWCVKKIKLGGKHGGFSQKIEGPCV